MTGKEAIALIDQEIQFHEERRTQSVGPLRTYQNGLIGGLRQARVIIEAALFSSVEPPPTSTRVS